MHLSFIYFYFLINKWINNKWSIEHYRILVRLDSLHKNTLWWWNKCTAFGIEHVCFVQQWNKNQLYIVSQAVVFWIDGIGPFSYIREEKIIPTEKNNMLHSHRCCKTKLSQSRTAKAIRQQFHMWERGVKPIRPST